MRSGEALAPNLGVAGAGSVAAGDPALPLGLGAGSGGGRSLLFAGQCACGVFFLL